jgi:hypothetical protein
MKDPISFKLRAFLIGLSSVILIGVVGFMLAEGLSLGNAIYFSIVTISTVGYGDVHPTTSIGRVLAIVLIIGGTGSFLGLVATSTEMILNKREKQMRLEKLNMIIGAFFSDVGTELLTYLSDSDPNLDKIRERLIIEGDWTYKRFSTVRDRLKRYKYEVNMGKVDLYHLKSFLEQRRNFLLRLLENPSLLEHENFSELLRAVFHFNDELDFRKSLKSLPESDLEHLEVDIKRIYTLLARQWLDYMEYLKRNYPYLFSLAIRTNPFDEKATPIVKETKK